MASSNSDKRSRQARAEQMRKERERADTRRRNGITIGIVAIVVVLIVVAGFAIKSQVDQNNDPATAPGHLSDGGAIVYDKESATGKPADGDPVTVTLYEDYQCPACKSFHTAHSDSLEQSVKKGEIEIEYRPIAFLDRMSSTNYSSRALNAAACVLDAKGPKAFHKMHDLMFENQPQEGGDGLPDEQLIELADQAGASGVDSCVADMKFKDWTKKVTENASDEGVSSTPTVQVDGKTVGEGVPSPSELQAAIAAASK